jgi:hypothetical protein
MRRLALPAAVLLAAAVGTASAADPPDALAAILRAHPEWFGEVLARAGEHRLQILYTQIDRDAANRPVFRSFSFGLTDEYFYPASTVKLPAAVLALEKLRDLAVPGLTRDTPLRIEAATAPQAAVDRDPSKADGLPTIAHYVKKVFLVSDNDAFNRLYEFLGQREINERLWSRGFADARILRRLEAALDPEENRLTNPFVFFEGERVLYPSRMRVFNKVGDAYGYLIDDAYVVDFEAGVEFLLTAVIHVNADHVFNDDAYEYDEIASAPATAAW